MCQRSCWSLSWSKKDSLTLDLKSGVIPAVSGQPGQALETEREEQGIPGSLLGFGVCHLHGTGIDGEPPGLSHTQLSSGPGEGPQSLSQSLCLRTWQGSGGGGMYNR